MANADNRREHKRYPLKLKVEIYRKGKRGICYATTECMSLGGLRLTLPDSFEDFQRNEELDLMIQLPNFCLPINIKAQVAWISDTNRKIAGLKFLEGLRAAHVWSLDHLTKDI